MKITVTAIGPSRASEKEMWEFDNVADAIEAAKTISAREVMANLKVKALYSDDCIQIVVELLEDDAGQLYPVGEEGYLVLYVRDIYKEETI